MSAGQYDMDMGLYRGVQCWFNTYEQMFWAVVDGQLTSSMSSFNHLKLLIDNVLGAVGDQYVETYRGIDIYYDGSYYKALGMSSKTLSGIWSMIDAYLEPGEPSTEVSYYRGVKVTLFVASGQYMAELQDGSKPTSMSWQGIVDIIDAYLDVVEPPIPPLLEPSGDGGLIGAVFGWCGVLLGVGLGVEAVKGYKKSKG